MENLSCFKYKTANFAVGYLLSFFRYSNKEFVLHCLSRSVNLLTQKVDFLKKVISV